METARIILGHRLTAIMEIYPKMDRHKAMEAVVRVGLVLYHTRLRWYCNGVMAPEKRGHDTVGEFKAKVCMIKHTARNIYKPYESHSLNLCPYNVLLLLLVERPLEQYAAPILGFGPKE